MKKTLLIIAAVIIFLGAVAFLFLRGNQTPTANNPTPGLPTASSTLPTPVGSTSEPTSTEMTVAARGGGQPIVVQNFINDGTTVPNPSNPGYYDLAESSPAGYSISYDSSKQFFTIALEKEPLSASRSAAEQFLLSKLGVSQAQLCGINYYVGTDVYTNSFYAGKNLGFSFCAGATALP